MKKQTIIYWISTGLFTAFSLFSAYMYLTAPEMKAAFEGLGFTQDYFRYELATAKILGALVLILPMVPKSLKSFAYAGFAINIASAIIAHVSMAYHSYELIIFAVITLATSYITFLKKQEN